MEHRIYFFYTYIVSLISYIISQGVPTYWLGAFIWFILINSFTKYGMDVLNRSAIGYNYPPLMRKTVNEKDR